MFPQDFPEYNGSIYNDEAYLVIVEPTYDIAGVKNWVTKKITLADLFSTERTNLASIEKLGTDYPVPTDGALAAYMTRTGVPELADKDGHESQFLLVGTDHLDHQSYLIATPGVVTMPAPGHNYTVGKTYYLGSGGVPTTEITKQKLFTALDKQRLIVY